MKKLVVYTLSFGLLSITSQSIGVYGVYPTNEHRFDQLNEKFYTIRQRNSNNPAWSEYKVSPDDTSTILYIFSTIKENVNKPINCLDDTLLKTCIRETSHFPEADAKEITENLLERGADISYNPQANSYPSKDHEAPLWSAALSGNAGAYDAILSRSQEDHLSRPYKDKILKLPYVIAFGLKRLKIMEDYYTSELEKIKNGERKEYFYKYFNIAGNGKCIPYDVDVVIENLQRVTWLKNQFQKMQYYNAQYFSPNKHNVALASTPETESLINKFLEERIEAFDEYEHAKVEH